MPNPIPARRRARNLLALAFGAAAIAGLVPMSSAHAQSIDDKRAEATKLEADIQANGDQVAALSEQIHNAEVKVEGANATITDAQARIDDARASIDRITELVRQRVASLYRSSANGGDTGDIFNLDIRSLSSREAYSSAASDRDNSLLDQLDAARQDLNDRRQEAEDAKAAAQKDKARLDAKKADYQAANAESERLLAKVKGELATLVAEAAAARAAAEAPQGVPAVSELPSAPPGSGGGGGGGAVGFAMAQVGKPYCNDGARFGTACFDCSGLVYSAYASAGRTNVPTVSGGWASYPSVPLSQLQPGDVITTSGWGSHVGIWVGGGYVHATSHANNPHAVKYVAGTSGISAAVRP
jgi:cell wall-associated NlpC family hydrolase